MSHRQLARPDVEGGGGEQRTIVQDIELSHGRWRMHPVKLPVNERKDQLFAPLGRPKAVDRHKSSSSQSTCGFD